MHDNSQISHKKSQNFSQREHDSYLKNTNNEEEDEFSQIFIK